MSEFSKYETLIAELNAIETQVVVLSNRSKEIASRNQDLEKLVKDLKNENSILLHKISVLENNIKEFETGSQELFSSIDPSERVELKAKLQSFLEKIEFHLSS